MIERVLEEISEWDISSGNEATRNCNSDQPMIWIYLITYTISW